MQTYKNIKELNKIMKSLGMRINEKGEILCRYKGKEEKIGQARPSTPEEITQAEAMEKKLKERNKKIKWRGLD